MKARKCCQSVANLLKILISCRDREERGGWDRGRGESRPGGRFDNSENDYKAGRQSSGGVGRSSPYSGGGRFEESDNGYSPSRETAGRGSPNSGGRRIDDYDKGDNPRRQYTPGSRDSSPYSDDPESEYSPRRRSSAGSIRGAPYSPRGNARDTGGMRPRGGMTAGATNERDDVWRGSARDMGPRQLEAFLRWKGKQLEVCVCDTWPSFFLLSHMSLGFCAPVLLPAL